MSIDTYFCFCCLSTNDLSPIYNVSDTNYGNILLDLFHLNISYEDYEYDGYICKECTQRLKDAVQFKTQVFDILNILQSNGLIELSNDGQQVNVKKVTNENQFDNEDKYDKLIIKDVLTFKLVPDKLIPVKKEPSQDLSKTKLDRDKATNCTARKGQKITQYEVSEDLKCEICGKEMPNAYVYHSHMNQHFPNHICDACGKGFLTEKRLKRHLPSHKTGPFKCQMCDAEFTNYNTLNSHRQRKHSAVQLYKCPYCTARFDTLTRRATHLTRTHARAPGKYECHVCHKRFLLAGNLSSHIRNKHQKVKRHFCVECRMGFFQKQDLTAHMATHTGLNMFQCAECPKRYPRKNALIVHMRTHTDDRRFSCEFCGKRFIQKCTLLVHVKTHSRDKNVAEK